jgi:predicted dehydrogenase
MKDSFNKLGIALLGLGKYAGGQLAPAFEHTQHCYLAGIVSADAGKAAEWQHKYDLPSTNIYNYDNFDSIKNNPAIQIVYVVTPNALHADFVIRAAAAGKHVICEKPMATTVEDCDRMIAACKKAGVMLSIGYRLHFEPYNREMMRLGTTQKYGPVQKIIAKHGLDGAEGWRLNKQLAGGGPLMDVGIYCLQAANYTSNLKPVAVTAQEGPKTKPGIFADIEQSVSFQLEYPGGYTAECECSYEKTMDLLHAETSNGWFELQPAFAYNGIRGKIAQGEMHFEQVVQQAVEMDSIALAIKKHQSSPVPGEMGREDVTLLLTIYKAMESGQRQLVNQ